MYSAVLQWDQRNFRKAASDDEIRPTIATPEVWNRLYPGRDDGVEVDIEAPAAMPAHDAAALGDRQFRRPRRRILSNTDLSR